LVVIGIGGLIGGAADGLALVAGADGLALLVSLRLGSAGAAVFDDAALLAAGFFA